MKAVILAGGLGTRISEESGIRPKPMVEIAGKPILWHIMKIYAYHGINEFIICCGYKGHVIKEYFAQYYFNNSDITFDMATNNIEVHKPGAEPWKITLVHTGHNTMTGGRLKRVKEYIGNETFCMTYGDGVSDVDITKLIAFHQSHGRLASLVAVQQPGRFGAFNLADDDSRIKHFHEKPSGADMPWINGGFFVLQPDVLDYVTDDDTSWEKEPLEYLAKQGELAAFKHTGFWQPMDTLRDKMYLEELWAAGKAAWYPKTLAAHTKNNI